MWHCTKFCQGSNGDNQCQGAGPRVGIMPTFVVLITEFPYLMSPAPWHVQKRTAVCQAIQLVPHDVYISSAADLIPEGI